MRQQLHSMEDESTSDVTEQTKILGETSDIESGMTADELAAQVELLTSQNMSMVGTRA